MTQPIPFVAPFIALEGDEATGKGVVATEVVRKLREKGIEVVHTREPGGTEIGELLREQLLLKRDEKLELATHILLHQAYRKEHIEKVIMPSLLAGKVVVCERFFMSTLALNVIPYNQTNPELYELFMATMPAVAGNLIEPITFLLDVPEDVRQLRLDSRPVKDHYESRTEEELAATSEAYKMFHKHETTVVLDGTRDIGALADHIVAQIEAQIKLAREQAESFAAQEQACSVNPTAEPVAPVVAEPVVETPFDLVKEVEGFLDEHLVPALFNGAAEEVEKHRPLARTYVLSLYEQAKDPGIFKGANRNQLRVNLHSIFYFGHQLDLLRTKSEPAATPV